MTNNIIVESQLDCVVRLVDPSRQEISTRQERKLAFAHNPAKKCIPAHTWQDRGLELKKNRELGLPLSTHGAQVIRQAFEIISQFMITTKPSMQLCASLKMTHGPRGVWNSLEIVPEEAFGFIPRSSIRQMRRNQLGAKASLEIVQPFLQMRNLCARPFS